MKPLIVFDFSGVLGSKNGRTTSIKQGVFEFLQKCHSNFNIAIWTSGIFKNYDHFMEELERKLNFQFVFTWYRQMTQLDPNYGIDPNVKNFDTIKNLSQIIHSPTINYDRYYHKDNILIVDDSIRKISMNKHYVVAEENDNFDILFDKIMKKFEEMK